MIPENRIVIASVIIGIIGAIVGGWLGLYASAFPEGSSNGFVFSTGIITGFLACFLLSILYLQWTNELDTHTVALNLNNPNAAALMKQRKWQVNVIGGLRYSVSAGTISAALTGFSMPISHGDYDPFEFLSCASYGVVLFGIPAGVIAWIILSIFYIIFVKKPLGESGS